MNAAAAGGIDLGSGGTLPTAAAGATPRDGPPSSWAETSKIWPPASPPMIKVAANWILMDFFISIFWFPAGSSRRVPSWLRRTKRNAWERLGKFRHTVILSHLPIYQDKCVAMNGTRHRGLPVRY